MLERQILCQGRLRAVCPLHHEISQVEVVVHGVVVELFLSDLVFLVLEHAIEPLKNV